MELKAAALEYLKHGYSVIPIKGKAYATGDTEEKRKDDSKKPLVKWEFFQSRLPSMQEIEKWWNQWPQAGIGIVTGMISGIAVIDIDSLQGKEQILPYIPDNMIFPIADTPRGGEHWYYRIVNNDLKNRAGVPSFTGVDIRAHGGYIVVPPTEGYNGKSYTWRQGLELLTTELPLIPAELYGKLPKKDDQAIKASIEIPKDNSVMFVEGSRDKDLFYTACVLLRGKMAVEQVYQVLLGLCRSCQPPMEPKVAEEKARSALKTAMERPRDLVPEVKQWVALQDGRFRIESCFNELSLQTGEQKATCRKIFTELSSQGIIEPDKGIGVYRLLNKNIDFIKIPDEDLPAVFFDMPLGLNAWVEVRQRNIIIVAGVSDSGKTAMLLNMAMSNMDKHKIRYQSSEMTGDELRVKLKNLPRTLDDFRNKVEWINRSEKWEDLILPDAVNFIDFMEIYENFYEVGGWIKKIHDKLRTGIAVIALQKKDGYTDTGRGGAITKEKARLYLSLDFGKLTIVKAKWWASARNPRGRWINFDLEQGVIFKNTDTWKEPVENFSYQNNKSKRGY